MLPAYSLVCCPRGLQRLDKTRMTPEAQVCEFRNSLRDGSCFAEMFDRLPDVSFYVKDSNYRLIMCNTGTVELLGLTDKHDIIGKSEYDFFPKKLADAIHQDDVMVIEEGRPLLDRIELVVDKDGAVRWFCTNKLPLYGRDGSIIGLMGTTRKLSDLGDQHLPYQGLSPVLTYIQEHYKADIDLDRLARLSGVSKSQFRKRFVKLFRLPPLQFILKLRTQEACRLLSNSDLGICEIGQECGFADHSYFSRQFRQQTGISPREYRERYR
jgi:PAS domain S-box-containing protein